MAWGQQTLLTSPPSIWSTNFHQTPHLQICYNLFFPSPEKSLLAWKHIEDHFLLHHESVIFWTVLQAVIPLLTKWRHTSNVSSSFRHHSCQTFYTSKVSIFLKIYPQKARKLRHLKPWILHFWHFHSFNWNYIPMFIYVYVHFTHYQWVNMV